MLTPAPAGRDEGMPRHPNHGLPAPDEPGTLETVDRAPATRRPPTPTTTTRSTTPTAAPVTNRSGLSPRPRSPGLRLGHPPPPRASPLTAQRSTGRPLSSTP